VSQKEVNSASSEHPSFNEKQKRRSPDLSSEENQKNGVIGVLNSVSLRWHYPDQVFRV